jgi:replicative DNA helicase
MNNNLNGINLKLVDVNAEMALIGCLIEEPNIFDDLVSVCPKPVDLLTDLNCIDFMLAFSVLHHKGEKVIDSVSVNSYLQKKGKINLILFGDECSKRCPSPINWKYYLSILQDLATLRETKNACLNAISQIDGSSNSNPTSVINDISSRFENLTNNNDSKKISSYSDTAGEAVDFLEGCYKRKGSISGITTGIKKLNKVLDGLHNGELITSLANKISDSAAAEGKNVLFFSIEMSRPQIMLRSICAHSELNYRQILDGEVSPKDFTRINEGVHKISKLPVYVDDSPSISVPEIRAKTKRFKRSHGVDLVVIDYLQIVTAHKKFETRALEIADYTKCLKSLARELNIPVVCLSQLSRESARAERKPRLSDLRDSGAIEQDADVVILLHRDHSVDNFQNQPYPLSLIVAKQRNGPVGDVDVEFVPQYTKIKDVGLIPSAIDGSPRDSFGYPT